MALGSRSRGDPTEALNSWTYFRFGASHHDHLPAFELGHVLHHRHVGQFVADALEQPRADNRVYEVIDGRTEVKAHGGRAMPVWGRDYSIKGAEYDLEVLYQPESYVRGKILSLIDYIYRMQVK